MSLNESNVTRRFANLFSLDSDQNPTKDVIDEVSEPKEPERSNLISTNKTSKMLVGSISKPPVYSAPNYPGNDTVRQDSIQQSDDSFGYSLHQSTVNIISEETSFGGQRSGDQPGLRNKERQAKKIPPRESSNLQFNMDSIVRQIRDDIITRCRKVCEKVSLIKYEHGQEAGIVPDELRADLEKRLADLIIVGERSGLSKHTLCVYELECHFHIKIAMVHIEGPTESIDKAVQLYRMGQFAEALPMLKLQLEKTSCYMHELVGGCLFNLGRIEEAGHHYEQAILHMKNRAVNDRTIKTEKQQANLIATAKNAKAKAGESLKNKQYVDAYKFYYSANVLFAGIENRQEGIDGMILSMGGMNDVIQALMKVDPEDGGSRETRDALHAMLEMHDLFSEIIDNCEVDRGYCDHCHGICFNIIGLAFECTERYTSAVERYKQSLECYSKIPDEKQKILRMRDCIVKARHAVRALTKKVGGVYSDGEIPMQVRQAMSIVLKMHSNFMSVSEAANVETSFKAENQAESLNSVGIGYYELRQFEQAESKLLQGIELLKQKLGPECRLITLAQLTYNMGLLKQDVGQITKAKQCFQEARLQYHKLEDDDARNEGMRKTEEALDELE